MPEGQVPWLLSWAAKSAGRPAVWPAPHARGKCLRAYEGSRHGSRAD